MADSGWVGFTSDGDEIRSYDIHCELATAVMIMQWAVSSTQLNKRCALGTACLSPVKYQVFRSSLAASRLQAAAVIVAYVGTRAAAWIA